MSSEHRYFNGVAGDTKHRGELFGITNMFKFSADHNSSGFAQQVFGRTRQTQNGVITARYEPIVAENEVDSNVRMMRLIMYEYLYASD